MNFRLSISFSVENECKTHEKTVSKDPSKMQIRCLSFAEAGSSQDNVPCHSPTVLGSFASPNAIAPTMFAPHDSVMHLSTWFPEMSAPIVLGDRKHEMKDAPNVRQPAVRHDDACMSFTCPRLGSRMPHAQCRHSLHRNTQSKKTR